MKKFIFILVSFLLSASLVGCSDEGYPKTYEFNKAVEHSNVIVTLNQVKEYMNEKDKVSAVEFTIQNNLNHPIQFPLSYHFRDDENNLHNLIGYSADDGATSSPTKTEDVPFEIPANKEAKITMDYEGFVKEFEWKLNVAIDNKIETFSFNIVLE
ncbi:hypothetical protein K0H71_17225 [Bacillus sp. IITD106]|nr:hypothetical protein [Bacillus sp. IITD106]